MMDEPFFSVLIPTRNRSTLVDSCVRAILSQGYDDYELLVIDQSDTDATREILEPLAVMSPQLRHVPSQSIGRSRALNTGALIARGQWIVITDDDCHPTAGWLAALESEVRCAGRRDVIVGRVLAGPVEPGMAPAPSTVDRPDRIHYEGLVNRDVIYPNVALPRRAIFEVGGFDVRLGTGTSLPGGEDNDFAYRLLRAGWRIVYCPVPTVVHRAWRSPSEIRRLKWSYGVGQGGFYAKHLVAFDSFIANRFSRDLLRLSRAVAGGAIRGKSAECQENFLFLAGLLVGASRMLKLVWQGGPNEPLDDAESGGTKNTPTS